MAKKKTTQQQAQELPFPPAGLQYEPGGMVEAALQLGAVIARWSEEQPFLFSAMDAKQAGNSKPDKQEVQC